MLYILTRPRQPSWLIPDIGVGLRKLVYYVAVTLDGPRGKRRVPTDAVLVLVGGVPSWDLLEKIGIRRGRAATADRADEIAPPRP